MCLLSQPTRAAWIEMAMKAMLQNFARRRSPLGLRGLKYFGDFSETDFTSSQPTRAAWIEIVNQLERGILGTRRSPLGLRGLKYALYE